MPLSRPSRYAAAGKAAWFHPPKKRHPAPGCRPGRMRSGLKTGRTRRVNKPGETGRQGVLGRGGSWPDTRGGETEGGAVEDTGDGCVSYWCMQVQVSVRGRRRRLGPGRVTPRRAFASNRLAQSVLSIHYGATTHLFFPSTMASDSRDIAITCLPVHCSH